MSFRFDGHSNATRAHDARTDIMKSKNDPLSTVIAGDLDCAISARNSFSAFFIHTGIENRRRALNVQDKSWDIDRVDYRY
jgi:hypothetical protein